MLAVLLLTRSSVSFQEASLWCPWFRYWILCQAKGSEAMHFGMQSIHPIASLKKMLSGLLNILSRGPLGGTILRAWSFKMGYMLCNSIRHTVLFCILIKTLCSQDFYRLKPKDSFFHKPFLPLIELCLHFVEKIPRKILVLGGIMATTLSRDLKLPPGHSELIMNWVNRKRRRSLCWLRL